MAIVNPPTDRDNYFSFWTLTEKGATDPDAVKQTIDTASAMIRAAGAECHLYVTIGGNCDFIGVAGGEKLDDSKIVEIQLAIRAFGTFHTVFVKGKEYSLKQFGEFISNVNRFRTLK